MSTIPSLLRQAVAQNAERSVLIEPNEGTENSNGEAMTQLTYQELQQRIQAFAGYLQQQQLVKGERLLIWSPSRINWLVAYLGATLLGLVVVPLDVNSKEDFLQRLVETCEVRYLITTRKLYHSLKQSSPPLIDIEILPEGPFEQVEVPEVAENDLAELVFTSGTTGHPKGVMLTHGNIVSNAHAAVEVVNITKNDRFLSILPLSHMFELTIQLAILHAGASLVYARSLSPETLFRLLNTQQVTAMVLVPQALQLFMNGIEREVRRQKKEKQWEILHAIASRLPFGLRHYLFGNVHRRFGGHFWLFVSGGAYLPPALGHRWENMGIRVLQGYGATECAPIIAANPPNDHTLESVGKPLPGIKVRLADDGEILVQGPNVSPGYWKNPEASAAAFHDGWYHTGDLGHFDARENLYIKGRKKNMIVLANGLNVYPEDVENVFLQQEGVKDAVVVGLEKGQGGPEVHAVVLTENPAHVKAAIQATNKQLAAHQQIRGHTLWPEQDFPRTHTLKIKRQEVLAQLGMVRGEI
jgi:long-chain acyl-CoA synthetase